MCKPPLPPRINSIRLSGVSANLLLAKVHIESPVALGISSITNFTKFSLPAMLQCTVSSCAKRLILAVMLVWEYGRGAALPC